MARFHHVNLGVAPGGIDPRRLADRRHRLPAAQSPAEFPTACWFEAPDGTQIHLSQDPDHRPAARAHVAVVIDDLAGLDGPARRAGPSLPGQRAARHHRGHLCRPGRQPLGAALPALTGSGGAAPPKARCYRAPWPPTSPVPGRPLPARRRGSDRDWWPWSPGPARGSAGHRPPAWPAGGRPRVRRHRPRDGRGQAEMLRRAGARPQAVVTDVRRADSRPTWRPRRSKLRPDRHRGQRGRDLPVLDGPGHRRRAVRRRAGDQRAGHLPGRPGVRPAHDRLGPG